jgi:hypothetical protein
MLEYQAKGFISTQLFDKWAIDVFFPHGKMYDAKLDLEGGKSICWMGAPATIYMSFLTCAMSLGLSHSFLIPTHSSHLTQALDVGMFALHKSAIDRGRSAGWMNAQMAQIMKILGAGQEVATRSNISSAFKQTGLHATWNREHRALVMSVDLSSAWKVVQDRTVQESRRQQSRINFKP